MLVSSYKKGGAFAPSFGIDTLQQHVMHGGIRSPKRWERQMLLTGAAGVQVAPFLFLWYNIVTMKRAITTQKIEEVAKRIGREFKPEKVILFGSWAWGKPNLNSDVDLCIIKETENTRALARKIDGSIFPRPFPLNLIVYHPRYVVDREKIGDFFVRNILTKGKVLYEK